MATTGAIESGSCQNLPLNEQIKKRILVTLPDNRLTSIEVSLHREDAIHFVEIIRREVTEWRAMPHVRPIDDHMVHALHQSGEVRDGDVVQISAPLTCSKQWPSVGSIFRWPNARMQPELTPVLLST